MLTGKGHAIEWLTEGGDERIFLNHRGVNQYGCGLERDPRELSFSSSTASTMSAGAKAAVEAAFGSLGPLLDGNLPEPIYAERLAGFRTRFLNMNGWEDYDAPDLIFAPSGTDAHLYIACLLCGDASRPTLVITVEGSETGSRIPAAASACHFSNTSALGVSVVSGSSLTKRISVEHVSIRTRDGEGFVRPSAEVETEIVDHIRRASREGRRALLIVADVSKTGLISPEIRTVLRIRERWRDTVDVMIDACQFRLSAASLRAYIAQGFLLTVTGSKFVGGPAFSGLIICPPELSARLSRCEIPPSLNAYANRAEWPLGWAARKTMHAGANLGLMLRWEAALFELERFYGVSENERHDVVGALAEAIVRKLRSLPDFELIPGRRLDRGIIGAANCWDGIQTIYPFFLKDARGSYLTHEQMGEMYRRLANRSPAIRLGQPVACGSRDGRQMSALRLCLSAALIVEAAESNAKLQSVIDRVHTALDAISQMVLQVTETSWGRGCDDKPFVSVAA